MFPALPNARRPSNESYDADWPTSSAHRRAPPSRFANDLGGLADEPRITGAQGRRIGRPNRGSDASGPFTLIAEIIVIIIIIIISKAARTHRCARVDKTGRECLAGSYANIRAIMLGFGVYYRAGLITSLIR